jgi:protein gp37
MAESSSIEWLFGGSTWIPNTGCQMHGIDCRNCFSQWLSHQNGAHRGQEKYQGITHIVHGRPLFNGEVNLGNQDLINLPRRLSTLRSCLGS